MYRYLVQYCATFVSQIEVLLYCFKKNQNAPKPSEHPPVCLKKNLDASRPSEHPPVRGENKSKRLGGIIGCKYKNAVYLVVLFVTLFSCKLI